MIAKNVYFRMEVTFEGDVRAMSEETRATIESEVRAKLEGISTMFGVTYDLDLQKRLSGSLQ